MGNVHASSNLPPMPPNMTPVPSLSTQQKLPPEERIENPGSVEELHKKCKGMFSVQPTIIFLCLQLRINELFFFFCRNFSNDL